MNRQKIRAISEDVEAAVQEVAERHGVQITTGRATYTTTSARLKLEIADIGEGGEALTPEREAFAIYAPRVGISADALGAEFEPNGTDRRFTITGWNTKARKRPILATRDDGREFVFQPGAVRRALPESLQLERPHLGGRFETLAGSD